MSFSLYTNFKNFTTSKPRRRYIVEWKWYRHGGSNYRYTFAQCRYIQKQLHTVGNLRMKLEIVRKNKCYVAKKMRFWLIKRTFYINVTWKPHCQCPPPLPRRPWTQGPSLCIDTLYTRPLMCLIQSFFSDCKTVSLVIASIYKLRITRVKRKSIICIICCERKDLHPLCTICQRSLDPFCKLLYSQNFFDIYSIYCI